MKTTIKVEIDCGEGGSDYCGRCEWLRYDSSFEYYKCILFKESLDRRHPNTFTSTLRCQQCLDSEVK